MKEVISSHLVVLIPGHFALKGKLGDLLKNILDISRGESQRLIDEPVQVDLTDIEPRQVVFQNGLSFVDIQCPNRNYAVEPSRAEQRGVQMPDVIGSAYEQQPLGFILE